jgi:hypothetical protein
MSGSSNALLDSLAHPAQINLLADYGGAAQTANAIWENRAWQAKQAAGQNFLNSINPDGTPNQNALLQGAKNTPGMALVAQPSAQAGQTLSADTQNQNLQLRATVNQMLPSLLNLPPDKLHAGVVNGFTQLENAGLMTHQRSLQIMSGFSNDPAQLQVQLGQLQKSLLPAQEQIDQTYGTRPAVNTGGATVFPVVPPASAGGAGPVVPMTTTPGERIAPVTGPATATGGRTTIPAADYARTHGLDPNTGQPVPNPAFSALPSSLRGPNAPPPAVSAPTQTEVGPAATQAMTGQGAASAASYSSINDNANKAVGRLTLLQNMAGDATQFTTGWGADRIKAVKSAAQRIAGIFGMSPVDAGKLAANEDLDKIGAQLADAQGAGSDARLAVNQGANPSSHNTPEGLRLILGKLQGNEDYNILKGKMATQYQQTQDPQGAGSRAFEQQFRDQFDPRVFQFNRLNGPQQKQYLSELGAGKDAFKKSFIQTKAAGVLPGG